MRSSPVCVHESCFSVRKVSQLSLSHVLVCAGVTLCDTLAGQAPTVCKLLRLYMCGALCHMQDSLPAGIF